MTDEEAIFAYIDGELDGEQRARIGAMIDTDPALQAMIAEHRALAGRLQSGFSTILEAPIPLALLAPVSAGADVSSIAAARTRREKRRAVWNVAPWGAMAATLVAGLIGGAVFIGGHDGPVVEQGRQLVASGRLEQALNSQLASTQGANAPVRISLTFKNHSGAICRSFTDQAAEGVACREGKAWQLQALLAREKGRTGDYRMAASSETAELVDRLIAGVAFDQAQEQDALAANWASAKAR
jgi:hypothetical protein